MKNVQTLHFYLQMPPSMPSGRLNMFVFMCFYVRVLQLSLKFETLKSQTSRETLKGDLEVSKFEKLCSNQMTQSVKHDS